MSDLWLRIHCATAALPESVACPGSALARHELAEVIPKRVQVAVPRGTGITGKPRVPVAREAVRRYKANPASRYAIERGEL
ncbi:hypothetical protein [Allokutzneria sp. NRRL B-24872]|uniref:hypothetical protein n=1 Tax=Allokutzneria sp. NRRL B-24872 TaxID=1137961 RepID=UPI000A37334E|nr:hypothetical protein [Allokutzneria sp. NRRL B-24872]